MSLNGIDTQKVADAFKTALTNDGAWLLLSYTSRDEVDLHQHGSDGLEGLRKAVSDYIFKSPLYGFIQYQSKKAVIKYIPDGTSRLLQARTSVHFSAVADKFSPYDAVLAASTPEDFSDANVRSTLGLSSAAPQPDSKPDTASATRETSSEEQTAGAQPQRGPQRLPVDTVPILQKPDRHAEDGSETRTIPRPSTAKRQPTPASDLQRELDDLDNELLSGNRNRDVRPKSNDVMGMKAFLTEVSPPHTSAGQRQRSPEREMASLNSDYRFSESEDPPKTSYSSRPSTSDLWRSWKPKLKLGPRPVTNEKPPGAVLDRQKLPSGMRMKIQRPEKEERPKSRKSERTRPTGSSSVHEKSPGRPSSRPEGHGSAKREPPPPMPPLSTQVANAKGAQSSASPNTPSPNALPQMSQSTRFRQSNAGFAEGRESRKLTGLGIHTSQPLVPVAQAPKSAPALTPEKQRLMRALQMRRQQQHKHDVEEPPMPMASTVSTSGSRGPTPDLGNTIKTDSGVDVEPSQLRNDHAQASPAIMNKTPFTGALNPLSSHPVNMNMPKPPPRFQNSPSPSTGSNKELPKLPKEAEEDQILQHASHPASGRSSPSKRKRGGHETPRTTTDRQDRHSEAAVSEGSEFYDEFETARVQEAKPLTVPPQLHVRDNSTNSPTITSVTIRSAGPQETVSHFSQANGSAAPKQPATASIQRHPSNSSRQPSNRPYEHAKSAATSRKNMSSGISRRIQALAELSQREGHEVGLHDITAYESAQAFLAPGTLPDERSHSSRSTAVGRAYEASRSRSPHKPSGGLASGMRPRTSLDEHRMAAIAENRKSENPTGYRKRDSLTVTAHIMRPHHQQMQQLGSNSISEEPNESANASPALGNGRPFSPTTEPPMGTAPLSPLPGGQGSNLTFTRRSSGQSGDTKRPASRGSAVSGKTRTSLEGWRSAFANMTSGRRDSSSSSRPRPFTSRSSTYDHSNGGRNGDFDSALDRVDEVSEAGTRASRTSRMFKRMSTISRDSVDRPRKLGRDSSADDPAERMLAQHRDEKTTASKRAAPAGKSTMVGDLNVQFPDTLLWKRRWVEVDAAGNLVLSPPSSTPGMRAGPGNARKFHLTEFKQPVVPSRDRQEMPHSVVLDFVEGGGTLQLAAEDRVQQGALVKRLVDAHRTWLYSL